MTAVPPIEGYVSIVDVCIWAAVAVGFALMHWRITNIEQAVEEILTILGPLVKRDREKVVKYKPADDANGEADIDPPQTTPPRQKPIK